MYLNFDDFATIKRANLFFTFKGSWSYINYAQAKNTTFFYDLYPPLLSMLLIDGLKFYFQKLISWH